MTRAAIGSVSLRSRASTWPCKPPRRFLDCPARSSPAGAERLGPIRLLARADLDVGERRHPCGLHRIDADRLRHRRFEQKLRRHEGLHLADRRNSAGLEVENLEGAILADVDAVGLAHESEPVGEGPLAFDLGVALGDVVVPAALELDEEPRRNSEAAQPDVAAIGDGLEAGEDLVGQTLETPNGAGVEGQSLGNVSRKDVVHQRAALAATRRLTERIERSQLQHVSCVNIVGRAKELFDLGDAEPSWSRCTRGLRHWALRRAGTLAGGIETLGLGDPAPAARVRRLGHLRAEEGLEPLDQARRGHRTAADTLRPRDDDFGVAHRHQEVVRGEAMAPLGRLDPDREPHAAAEPGAGIGGLGPDVLVESGEDHQVWRLETGLETAPDGDIVALRDRAADGVAGHETHQHRIEGDRRQERTFAGKRRELLATTGPARHRREGRRPPRYHAVPKRSRRQRPPRASDRRGESGSARAPTKVRRAAARPREARAP